MSSKLKLLVSLSVFALLLFTISAPTQIAKAIPERAVTPSEFITMPAASFVPDDTTVYYRDDNNIESNQTNGQFYAPIILPEGATLRRIYISYVDPDPSGSVLAEMRHAKLSAYSNEILGSVESSIAGNSGSAQIMTLQVNKLINRYHVYTLHITMDKFCLIYGIRVEYAMP